MDKTVLWIFVALAVVIVAIIFPPGNPTANTETETCHHCGDSYSEHEYGIYNGLCYACAEASTHLCIICDERCPDGTMFDSRYGYICGYCIEFILREHDLYERVDDLIY